MNCSWPASGADAPDVRVLALRGPGGVGKTRLAQELLRTLAPSFDLGGRFVDLAPLRGEGQLLPAIAQALPASFSAESPLDALERAVGRRLVLLVLDDLEHLPHPEADLAALCGRLPGARLLVTSRRVLRLRGVRELPLAPLPVPLTPAQAADSAAARLFVQRAQDVDPDFALTPQNAALITAVCTALDGLPLALELAAARLRAVDLRGLLAWLQRPLEVLSGGPLDDAPRRQSLRHAVRWSYELLGPAEREVFVACGAFIGGFTLDALDAVCGVRNTRAQLIALVEHSLVQPVGGPEARWRLLEPVREFAAEQLQGSAQAAPVAGRHARYFLDLAERAGAEQQAGSARLQAENANVLAAVEHFLAGQATEPAQRLVVAMFDHWIRRGGLAQTAELYRRVLALPGDCAALPSRRATVLDHAALLARLTQRHAEAEAWARESLAIRQASGDPAEHAGALIQLAVVLSTRGEKAQAAGLIRQALALSEARQDLDAQAAALHELGFTLHSAGDTAAGLRCLDRAVNTWQTLHDPVGEAYSSGLRARMHVLGRQLDAGRRDLRRSWELSLRHNIQDPLLEESLLHIAALLAERLGHPALSVRLAAASASVQARSDICMPPTCEREREELLQDLRVTLPPGQFTGAWEAGAQAGPEAIAADLGQVLHDRWPPDPHLTPREREVLSWVAGAAADKKIAQTLGISAGTVGKHVASLLDKLELHNRVELARWVLHHHLTP